MTFDPFQSAPGPEQTVTLKPRSSRVLIVMVLGMTVLALISISISALALPIQIALLAIVLLLAVQALIKLGLGGPREIILESDRMILVSDRQDLAEYTEFRRLFMSPWYLGVLAVDGRSKSVCRLGLFRDQFRHEDFRRLSFWFRNRQ